MLPVRKSSSALRCMHAKRPVSSLGTKKMASRAGLLRKAAIFKNNLIALIGILLVWTCLGFFPNATAPEKAKAAPNVAQAVAENAARPVAEEASEQKTETTATRRQNHSFSTQRMSRIGGNSFYMGCAPNPKGCSNDERPMTRVTLSNYYIGRYEVTFSEFDAYYRATGRRAFGDQGWGRGNHPVNCVSWLDAVKYCNWLSEQDGFTKVYDIQHHRAEVIADWTADGYRLPTEAEWEYAAREGGRNVLFGNGSDWADPYEINFNPIVRNPNATFYRIQTVPVGSLTSPNSLGLHDMSGNLYEWCWDWYGPYPGGKQNDYRGPRYGAFKVVRGGAFVSEEAFIRTINRACVADSYQGGLVGFRLARTAK
ncbi:MAG TPA: SUMF1/EgtB/PvdO family nonheme iron enzyme [Saprospiraceae bacterium]|nr:SUMF1/EgtB/PvdO family nonheme iron enzyme [Saprospiraceae bacterium]HRK80758.1 SUMF1/EgtB/PvdO family nonheme iron enzyme [Saprospiraceae bacterium]